MKLMLILSLPVAASFCVPFVSGKKSSDLKSASDFGLQSLYHGDLLLVSVSIQSYQLGCLVAIFAYLLLHVWCLDVL